VRHGADWHGITEVRVAGCRVSVAGCQLVEPDLIPRWRERNEGLGLVYLAGHIHSITFDGLLGTKPRMGAYMCLTKAFLRDRSV
jgi:hypothetical protein